jgi:FtsP/CotA-like multicopper oxidase with cupredoxin domain
MVDLVRIPSPFGVTVSADGHHLAQLRLRIEGLPDPSTLGDYSTYVAWVTPLELDPMTRLGEVGNGSQDLGRVGLNKYLILISAEASPAPSERAGPLVLRGRSPSARMEAHDMLAQAPSAEEASPEAHLLAEAAGWAMPPPYEGVPMLPGVMALAPEASPLLLEWTGGAELPEVAPRELISLPNGGTLDLEAGFVRRSIAGRDLVMLAFNGQHPGPLVDVEAGSTIFVNFSNQTPFPTAVHWHGVRLDNEFDGVPGVTQDPVPPGGDFQYRVHFPDAGIYWYHPHHREDVQQEMGLYGNLLVAPLEEDYYAPVNRQEVLMLDDLLLSPDGPVAFGEESANYMLMGRFGNVPLVNGEPSYAESAAPGEVVRLFLTNASNTRTFNVSLRRGESVVPMKVVATDVGKFEREERIESVVIAPAERYVVDVLFDTPGEYRLVNQVQGINHRMGVYREEVLELGTITVAGDPPLEDHRAAWEQLRENRDVVEDIDRVRGEFDRPIDHEIVLTLETDSLPLAIEQSMRYDWVFFNPVEWTGTMPVMNWATTGREVAWTIREPATQAENDEISWRFRVGDVVKIRVHNDRGAWHAMQHPLHIHGQRFLVLEQDGVPNTNLAWKDTALLPVGSTTDILLELSNPGRWMVHCHIAEHLESGMKFVFEVEGGQG